MYSCRLVGVLLVEISLEVAMKGMIFKALTLIYDCLKQIICEKYRFVSACAVPAGWHGPKLFTVFEFSACRMTNQPAKFSWIERSTWKLEVAGSIPGLVNLTTTNCLSDETLNRGLIWRGYTPSALNNQTELSVVSSSILALSPVTTNRLLWASLEWATGSDDKWTEITKAERQFYLRINFGCLRVWVLLIHVQAISLGI